MTQSTFFRQLQTPHTLLGVGKQDSRSWAALRIESSAALAQLLQECCQSGIKVLTGPQRELPPGDAGGDESYVFVDLRQINRVVEHRRRDQVISVETGITLEELDSLLKQNGQWWPVSAVRGRTVYDVIHSGDGGSLEHGYGGPRNLVLGLEAILPSGKAIKSGGKVVKNVTGYDMTKLFIGARGTLALPYLAHLRLFSRPQSSACLLIASSSQDLSLLRHANTLMSSGLPIAVLEIIQRRMLPQSAEAKSFIDRLASWPSRLVMVVRIFENEKVIAEIMPQLQSMAAPDLVQMEVSDDMAQDLLPTISRIPERYYEISSAPSVMARLLCEDQALMVEDGLQIRPGAGRLRIANVSCTPLVARLRAWAKRRVCAFSGAEVDGDRYTVHRYPQEDAAADEITQSLKKQFDPDACLNPFVRFST